MHLCPPPTYATYATYAYAYAYAYALTMHLCLARACRHDRTLEHTLP